MNTLTIYISVSVLIGAFGAFVAIAMTKFWPKGQQTAAFIPMWIVMSVIWPLMALWLIYILFTAKFRS